MYMFIRRVNFYVGKNWFTLVFAMVIEKFPFKYNFMHDI